MVTGFMIFHLIAVIVLKFVLKDYNLYMFEKDPKIFSLRNLNIYISLIVDIYIFYKARKEDTVSNKIAWAFSLNLIIPKFIAGAHQGSYLIKIINLIFINNYISFCLSSAQKKKGMYVCFVFFILMFIQFIWNPNLEISQTQAVIISFQILSYLFFMNN